MGPPGEPDIACLPGTTSKATGPGGTAGGSTLRASPEEVGPIKQRAPVTGVGGRQALRRAPVLPTASGRPRDTPPGDELFRLVPLVTAIRWATTAVSVILLSTGNPSSGDAVIGAVMLSYALWRTIRPVDFSGGAAEILAVLIEAAAIVAAVVATGYWDSPFTFLLVTAISAAGFSGGIPLALQLAVACFVAVATPYHTIASGPRERLTIQWAGELVLVAILAGYARRLSMQARAETSRYAGRLRQLSEVNDLLLQLRNVAQAVPMSLDLADTLDSSVARLQQLFQPDTVVVLLRDDDQWTVARCLGANLTRQLRSGDLPPLVRQVIDADRVVLSIRDADTTGILLGVGSEYGLYCRLCARDELVGVVGVERRSAEPFGEHGEQVMQEFGQQMAIAVDNARWFSRIGTLAAEQERSRIARDLHDRVGQSLALVGFELDRVTRKGSDPEVNAQLLELREHVRSVVSELRDTLHDLRTDVSEEQDLVAALSGFLQRVGERSGMEVELEHQASHRLSLNVEREVWRIAQEAVFNVERHAAAKSLKVTWISDAAGAELTVADDGNGLPRSAQRSTGGYGLLGMQERAQAVDATLELNSLPGRGTTVRLSLRR